MAIDYEYASVNGAWNSGFALGGSCAQQSAYGVWDAKAEASEFGAFYIEAVQGTGGYVISPADYFKRLKGTCDKHKILIVDDEVQMGFYRTGKFWAIENFGITPDIIVFGKALTNGLNPISGIWAREELISPEAFPPGSTHSTFSSNPLGTAVALETLKMLEEENYETLVNEKGAYFLAGLRELERRHPESIGQVDGLGLALLKRSGGEFTRSRSPHSRAMALQPGAVGGPAPELLGPSLHRSNERRSADCLGTSIRACYAPGTV